MARSRAAGSEPGILLRGEGPFGQSSKGPSPLKLPPSSKSSFFWSVEGNGGAPGVAVPSVSVRRGQGLIGAAVSGQQTLLSARRGKKAEGRSPGEGDGGRCISVSGEKSRTAASLLGPDSWILGSEAGRIFEGLYHGQAFFCRTVCRLEGRNDGALPCSHAMAAGPVCPCGEMKETVCNRA